MSHILLRPRSVALAAAMLLSLAGAVSAQQATFAGAYASTPRTLSGAYGFSMTQTCVRTPFMAPPANGIDATTKQMLVNGEFVSGFGNGTLRFKRDGSVAMEDALITEITAGQTAAGQSPVSAGTRFGCQGTYQIQPDGKLSLRMVCETAPPAAGIRVLIQPVEFEGFVAGGGQIVNLGTYKRDIHTVTVYSGATPVQQRQRMCLQSLNLDRR